MDARTTSDDTTCIVNISGGDILRIRAFRGSEVNLIGRSFALDGVDISASAFAGPTVISSRDATLTGVLDDGTMIDLSLISSLCGNQLLDRFYSGATLTVLIESDVSPPEDFASVYNIGDVIPGCRFDIGPGDIPGVLTTGTQAGDGDISDAPEFISPLFLGGDTLDSNSQLNLFPGGILLRGFDAGPADGSGINVELNIFGGTVGADFNARGGGTVNVFGGTIASDFDADPGSNVTVFGGDFARRFEVRDTVVDIFGGSFGDGFAVREGGIVNIGGGTFERFQALSGSIVNLIGSSFSVDGVELTCLVPGIPFEIAEVDTSLIATLQDGSVFDFDFDFDFLSFPQDELRPDAILTVCIGPPGDFNQDRSIDGLDLTDFVAAVEGSDSRSDIDRNGERDFFDVVAFLAVIAQRAG